MEKVYHITIVGTGKVAHQVGLQLKKAGHVIDNVWGRNKERVAFFVQTLESAPLDDIAQISPGSIALICVSDTAIPSLIERIPNNIQVAYTSGSVRIENLNQRKDLGVFYPLQTFSEGRSINISEVPFLIEASNEGFHQRLTTLAKTLSNTVVSANSNDRYNTHIAAVMVNNFSNFLFHLAQKQMEENHLDFSLLKPLIRETVEKLNDLSPLAAQTGPAARGDKAIIEKHIASIQEPSTKELYRLFSELIYKTFNQNEL